MTSTVISCIGDQIVKEDADAHFARIEAERTQARHVANLLGLSAKHDRQGYLWNLANREGPDMAERVKAVFAVAWEARRK